LKSNINGLSNIKCNNIAIGNKDIINILANHNFFIYRFGKQWINKEGIIECFDLILKRR